VNTIRRGVRNLWRAPMRSVMLVAVLGLAVGVFLTLAQAAQAVGQRTSELAGSYQNLIEVRAAGATGMGVGADALPQEFFQPAQQVQGVSAIEPYLYQRTQDPAQPVPLSIFVGIRPADTMRVSSHGEVGSPTIVAGRRLGAEDSGQPVAVVGTVYAEQYGLEVGDALKLPPDRVLSPDRAGANADVAPLELEVVGVFDADFAFGNNQVFLPLEVAQEAFGQNGKITHVFVTAASVDQVEEVEEGLQKVFGDGADVISGQETAAQFSSTLGAIRTNSLLGAGVALAVAALVIGFAMALVTTERRTEIGVLKAIGASRADLVRQYLAETSALALLGTAAGYAVFLLAGGVFGNLLLGRAAGALPSMTSFGESPLQALGIDFGASLVTLLLAGGGVLLLGAVGNLIPVLNTLRLQPAEAIRDE
jgi:ABC-type antimicrobial peptide transport system permease subunit